MKEWYLDFLSGKVIEGVPPDQIRFYPLPKAYAWEVVLIQEKQSYWVLPSLLHWDRSTSSSFIPIPDELWSTILTELAIKKLSM